MDNICANENRLRFNCSESLDGFEPLDKLGQKIRPGRDLYDFAKGSCLGAFVKCGLAERNKVEAAYKIQIQTDLATKDYMDALNYAGGDAAREVSDEYAACMASFCGGPGFPQCSAVAEIERRMPRCEAVLAKTPRPMAVKRDFYETLLESLSDACAGKGGSVDYDTKKCEVKVDFALPEIAIINNQRTYTGRMNGAPLASRTFSIGEIVECTQEYFSVTHRVYPEKKHGWLKTTFGGIKAAIGGVAIVGGIIASVFTAGAAIPVVGAGVSLASEGVADIIQGKIMMETGQRDGACFINGAFATTINNYFRVSLLQK
jgi:hypothetical protein